MLRGDVGLGYDALTSGAAESQFPPPAGMGRFGQYDVYEAGLLGAGMGAYVRDPSEGGMEGLGSYIRMPEPYEVGPGAVNGMGGYVPELPAHQGGGYDVQVAPAGFGTAVYEAPAGFRGGSPFDRRAGSHLDDDMEDLSESALDLSEAAFEGLGAVHADLMRKQGMLLYATPEAAGIIAGKGLGVFAAKPTSTRYPGIPVVAVLPVGGLGQLSAGVRSGTIPISPSATQGEMFGRTPAPNGGQKPRRAGGVFEGTYDVESNG